MFIRLLDAQGRPLFVNPQQIGYMKWMKSAERTSIYFVGGGGEKPLSVSVKETPEAIMKAAMDISSDSE